MKNPVQSYYLKSIILTLSFALVLFNISPGQAIRYVTLTGNDATGDGTLAKPYATILKGITALTTVAGDTIKVGAGTYIAAATTTVSKSVAIIGTAGTILNRGSYATSGIVGFTITANNVTIRKIKVTNYNVGISNTVAITNLTLDSVQLFENWGAGFYSTLLNIDSLAITNSLISYNGKSPSNSALKRGIYLLNGPAYSKIKLDKDTVENNGLAGIEISLSALVTATTSMDGVTITNNIVRNNADAQISTWLSAVNSLKKAILISNNTIVLSDTARYGIEIRNPLGNGQTSGNGSVVVSNNAITVVSHTGNSRDIAAIAVVRRKEGATNAAINDQPVGVVISGNTISDFQNPKAGEAYGIVFGGIGHKVFGNVISNTEFPLQLQKGNVNYLLNTSTPDVVNQTNNLYFDRDNSKEVCVEVGSNTITTSGSPRLTTGVATTFLTLRGTTTNIRTGDTFCTIQQAIDFAATTTGDTITVNPGTYNEAVTVTKSLAIIGTGTTSSDVVLDAPFTPYTATAGTGFAVSVNNVTIKKIKATNFNVGVSTTISTISGLRLDSVALIENFAAGFYSTFSLTGLSITNSTLSYNGNKPGFPSTATLKRGIYLLNGPAYAKIVFDNNSVEYNDSTGIEISSTTLTTSIDSVIITNNIVRYNKEAQISAWLGTSTPLKKAVLISNNTIVLSDSARYGIEIRNPAGNGTTSGSGSVVVSNNTISVINHTGNSRDIAAIAVVRRKEGASGIVNDQPQGVVVSGNTISDFQNPKAGEAYGIIFGGTGHKVFGNIISNTEFPIQLQKGNANFAANTSAPDIGGQTNNLYFDRDNSKDVCVEIGSNTITASGASRLTTGIASTSLTLPATTTANSTLGVTFCTLQQAIDFKGTVAGNTITASAGTYDEQVIINKSLIIDGVDSSNRLATFTGTPTGVLSVFTVAAQNVTIKNFKFTVDLYNIYSAIANSVNASGLLITGNTVFSYASVTPIPATLLYRNQNAININILGSGTTSATIQSNTIGAIGNIKFRAAIAADASSVLVGGNSVNNGNTILANVNHDVIIRNYIGDETVKNNIFKGGGVEISISNGNGVVNVSDNTFDGTYAHTINSAMARIFTNGFAGRTINFTNNHFINQKWAISFENTRNVVLDHNDITAAYDSFRLISVNTKLRQTTSPLTLEMVDIKLTNNNLNGPAGLTTGTGIEFLNFDQRPPANNYTAGNYVIGELGNENNFNANIPTFIKVSNLDGYNTTLQPFLDLYPEYTTGQYPSTTGYWTRDIFARHNRYFVNGALKLASTFGEADWNAVYQSIFDRQDDINIGAVVLMPTWSGAKSTDWSLDSNWSYNFVPVAGLDAVIYPQIRKPVLTVDASCDTLILSSGMSVTTGSNDLTVYGNIRSNGIIYGSLGRIILGGNASQVLSGSIIVKDLTLNNASGASIAPGDTNKVIVSGIYTPTQGILATNDNLTLKSDSAGTAGVNRGSSSGGYITGRVTVERYLSARKGWRFLSIPTNTTQTIKQTWQEGGTSNTSNPVTGYGIQITGAGGPAAGFDLYSASPSMKTYVSETNTWAGIASTATTGIKDSAGYMIFVRGDRTANAVNSTPTQTTLRTQGDLYTGDLAPIPVSANKFVAIGNPYASQLDMRLISKTGLKDFFYLWDPKLAGALGFGGYQTFSKNGSGNYDVTPGMGSYGASDSVNNFIESGQAFLVQATGAGGSFTFTEDAKTNGSGQVSRTAGSTQPQLRTSLYGVNADGSAYIIDGVLSNYDNNYSNSVDDMDAIKSTNISENLSIKTANTLLAVERRYSIIEKDTIFLNLTNLKVQKYRYEFTAKQLGRSGITAFLEDNYLETATALNLSGITVVDFNIVNIPGSYAPNRFRIVFTPASLLPLTFKSIKASQHNKNVAVEWTVENESNVKQYSVEKSTDGNHFTIGKVIAAGNASYSNYNWLDVNPSEGYNYYRVLITEGNGKKEYSTVVKVFIGKAKQDISIYPNPVTNGIIHLQLTNEPGGIYGIRLLNKVGQILISKQINHAGGSSTETIEVDKHIVSGVYQIEVSKPDGISRYRSHLLVL